MSVSIYVGLPDHLIDFLVSELFSQVSHHVSELGSGDKAVAVSIEHLEGFDKFFLSIGVLHFSMDQLERTWPLETEIPGNLWCHCRLHRPR